MGRVSGRDRKRAIGARWLKPKDLAAPVQILRVSEVHTLDSEGGWGSQLQSRQEPLYSIKCTHLSFLRPRPR